MTLGHKVKMVSGSDPFPAYRLFKLQAYNTVGTETCPQEEGR